MQIYIVIVNFLFLLCFAIAQNSYSYSGQYNIASKNEIFQQENQIKQSSLNLNNFETSTNDQLSSSLFRPNIKYLVGNLSEPYSFEIAPPSVKIRHLNFNGFPLYAMDMGFSIKSKYNYDEKNNRLTIFSLDLTTVGYYAAVGSNWTTFTSIISAINTSSLVIENFHVDEDNIGSSLVSCSVSIIRSTFKLTDPFSPIDNKFTKTSETEYLPRLDLLISTRTSLSSTFLFNKKIYNDTLYEQYLTRKITIERPLTRADHNGTIQCQVESYNHMEIYFIKNVSINIEYGPHLEIGASPKVNLESEVMKSFDMECQIEANPTPSYVWYELSNNISTEITSEYDRENSYGKTILNEFKVFGKTRQISKIYEHTGQSKMQCQAQSRGKTVKQEFIISIHPESNTMMKNSQIDGNRGNSYKTPILIGTIIGSILLIIVVITIITMIILSKRRKIDRIEKVSSTEKISKDKQNKSRWGSLPIDYSKYKHESLKTDSSSTSHLVESVETSSAQVPPPIPARPSPMISTHSSYRQTPLAAVSLSYRQASALPGFRSSIPTHSYSPERDDVDENSTSINGIPLTTNRLRTPASLGSHKSLSESIQSLRSNQQTGVSLPVKKRSQDIPPILPKREQKPSSPNVLDVKNDYHHHHYHNPAQLRAQQKIENDNTSSEEEEEEEVEFEHQQTNQISQDSVLFQKKLTHSVATNSTTASSGYNQVNFVPENGRRLMKSIIPQQINVHQTTGIHRDEAPPSYQEVTNTSPSHAYVYQEPTEV